MDFWNESAMPNNYICMRTDAQLGEPGTGPCVPVGPPASLSSVDTCLSAVDIQTARFPDGTGPSITRNSGCKNDGGPLWISIDFPEENAGLIGLGGFQNIYGRIFQKKQAKK